MIKISSNIQSCNKCDGKDLSIIGFDKEEKTFIAWCNNCEKQALESIVTFDKFKYYIFDLKDLDLIAEKISKEIFENEFISLFLDDRSKDQILLSEKTYIKLNNYGLDMINLKQDSINKIIIKESDHDYLNKFGYPYIMEQLISSAEFKDLSGKLIPAKLEALSENISGTSYILHKIFDNRSKYLYQYFI